jgi:hypothetical protein
VEAIFTLSYSSPKSNLDECEKELRKKFKHYIIESTTGLSNHRQLKFKFDLTEKTSYEKQLVQIEEKIIAVCAKNKVKCLLSCETEWEKNEEKVVDKIP